MPYIATEKRNVLDPYIDGVLNALRELESDDPSNNMGANLNYTFTKMLLRCYGDRYAEMAQAVSVLEMAKLEYYRVVCSPYETQKSHDHGSVE